VERKNSGENLWY